MISSEAFLLLSLSDASVTIAGSPPEQGVLNLECVSVSTPDSKDLDHRNVYLVIRVNLVEVPIDPTRAVRRLEQPGRRLYSFGAIQDDPTELVLSFKVPHTPGEELNKLDAFDNIIEQYSNEFHGSSAPTIQSQPQPATIAGQSTTVQYKNSEKQDYRGQLVMVNEDTGEVVGHVEDRFRIQEDPLMYQKGHESDPVIIEVGDESLAESDANALQAFARIVPPEQRNWITSSANIVSHAISMSTNLLLTTITAASSFYISHSSPSPHHSGVSTPTGNGSTSHTTGNRSGTTTPGGAAPPPPPRALLFLTSEKTRNNLATVHAYSGQAVKISTKTVNTIDNMIRKAIGSGSKRQKYFAHVGQNNGNNAPRPSGSSTLKAPGPPLPPRSRSPSPAPPAYYGETSPGGEKPVLQQRQFTSPLSPSTIHQASYQPARQATRPPPLPARLKTKDHILISADLILSTIDHSTRRVLDVGTEQIGRVVGHKYGPEAAQSSLLMTGTARNVGLVYVDMSGIGRRALLKRAGRNFVKAQMASRQAEVQQPVPVYPVPSKPGV